MSRRYPQIAFGDSVKDVQSEQGSRSVGERLEGMEWEDQRLGERERALMESLDHFFMASMTESGWPYLQFRGGPTGFLRVLDEKTIGFADFRGNLQYISVGNVRHDDRVSLFLLDQANRTRLKIFARAEVREVDATMRDLLVEADYPAAVERAYLFHIEAFDWNCPQHITPRFSIDELRSIDPEVLAGMLTAELQVETDAQHC